MKDLTTSGSASNLCFKCGQYHMGSMCPTFDRPFAPHETHYINTPPDYSQELRAVVEALDRLAKVVGRLADQQEGDE